MRKEVEKESPVPLTIKVLLSEDVRYVIPMYQRNYAWEEGEITQLIQDVIDYLPRNQNYYIGTLVVFERHNQAEDKRTVYETLDGQQRLTTLSLLACYLRNTWGGGVSEEQKLNLGFDSRPQSQKTLEAIFGGKNKKDHYLGLAGQEINQAILDGYRLIETILPRALKGTELNGKPIEIQQFADYLFDKVQIMRVKVPHDTNLNHYFEIMNSRGEQLEKHEVLKAQLMALLHDKEDENCLHAVWEACANMEIYVQMGFPSILRNQIFGEAAGGQFKVKDFDELKKILTGTPSDSGDEKTLDQIINQPPISTMNRDAKDEKNDAPVPDRFNSVINFQNFLLQVLRIQTEQRIPLDDKQLIATFEEYILKSGDPKDGAKVFIFNLLRCKYLFDQFIIKRDFIKKKDGDWSLQRLKSDNSYANTFDKGEEESDINRRVLMLLSAFHVSAPTQVNKHWLNAALYHLFTAKEIQVDSYLVHLESIAKTFVFDRFLSRSNGLDYFEMIYTNKGVCQMVVEHLKEEVLESKLSFDGIQNNLVFNYLDYLLWLKRKDVPGNSSVTAFTFTFRSSVEHYHPQNPIHESDILPNAALNSFGNLCLISHSKNSTLSNNMPTAKKEHYKKSSTIDSVKQHLMMVDTTWDAAAIFRHYKYVVSVLVSGPKSGHSSSDFSPA